MDAFLLTVGDELLSGRTLNSNAAYIGKKIAEAGAPVAEAMVVGDRVSEIAQAVKQAAMRYPVVVVTGGLGPTHDDVTLLGIALGLSLPLVEDPGVLKSITERYRRMDRAIPPGVTRMARIPQGARVLPNHWGTAPGLQITSGQASVFVLPGVPREMRGILDESVIPVIRTLPGTSPLYFRAVVTAGVPESSLSERIADLIPPADGPIRLAFLPGYSGVEVRLTTVDSGSETAVDQLAAAIAKRVGPALVGEIAGDDLVSRVGELLRARGATLATAESCTGGLLGKLLTDRAGSSDFYLGGLITYANSAKHDLLGVPSELLERFGAVSAETALAMAKGARERFGSDFALSITGIAGPGGATPEKPVGLIFLGLAWPGGESAKSLQLSTDREQNRERAAYSALNYLRLHLIPESPPK